MLIRRAAALLLVVPALGGTIACRAQNAANAIAAMNEVQLAITLSAAAEATARKTPMAIDRFTLLKGSNYEINDKAMVFRYDVSAEVDKEALKAHVIRANCASPRLSAMFDRGIRARHMFTTPVGLLEVPVTQADCKAAAKLPSPAPSPDGARPAINEPPGTNRI
jgi:hypothetical protein